MALVIVDTVRTELEALCRAYHVNTLKLFGSATTDDFDPARSDLDFLVIFDRPGPDMGLAQQFFGFHEALQILFGRRVDLLEEPFIENSVLRRSALASAKLLYAAPSD